MAQPLRHDSLLDAPDAPRPLTRAGRAVHRAYLILYAGFIVLPLLAGTDKFLHLLVNWDQYLAPRIAGLLPVSGHTFMLAVGVIEIVEREFGEPGVFARHCFERLQRACRRSGRM